jgi:hypothetical protein
VDLADCLHVVREVVDKDVIDVLKNVPRAAAPSQPRLILSMYLVVDPSHFRHT